MKILIINGSHRKNGATATILNEIYYNLTKYPNVEAEIIHLSDLKLNFCTGCCSCYTTGKCIFDDDLETLSHRIKNADGLILGSPTYACNISAQMKLLIDRCHFIMEQLLRQKYAICVSTYENYGGKDTLRILNNLLLYSGSQISGRIVAKIEFNTHPLKNITLKNTIARKTKRLYYDILNRRNHSIQRMLHSLVFNIGIKPFVLSKGVKYNGVINHWNS